MVEKSRDPFANLPRRSLFGQVSGDVVPDDMDIVCQPIDSADETLRTNWVAALEAVAQDVLPPEALDRSHVVSAEAVTKLGEGDHTAGIAMLDALVTALRKRGRPRAAEGYPGPECGLSRAQWYRERKKKSET